MPEFRHEQKQKILRRLAQDFFVLNDVDAR